MDPRPLDTDSRRLALYHQLACLTLPSGQRAAEPVR